MVDNNPALTSRCELLADHDAVGAAIAHAKGFAADMPCGAETESRLLVLIEEAVSNIVEHGEVPAGSTIAIGLAATDDGIVLTIVDSGTFFDPRTHVTREMPGSHRGGGAGIALIKAWSRRIDYARNGDRNLLTLVIADHG